MISLEEGRAWALSACPPLAPVARPAAGSLGLVLAAPVTAAEDVPPFANSSMDGYAVRASDVAGAPVRLRVAGALMAGGAPDAFTVGEGEAVRIMTGAPIPPGADAVCMVEHTQVEGDRVVIEEAVATGTNVRRAGDDVAAGEAVFDAGVLVGPRQLAVLVGLGVAEVKAHPQPRVAVLSTGDELVDGAGPLPLGKIRDSNRPALLAQLGADGFAATDLGRVADDPGVLREALGEAAGTYDAILTSGGVSVGDRDVVRAVLEGNGSHHARWMQVAVRPAKPFAFSTYGPRAVPVFGLPGNPVSALVSYELFARPALRQLAGHRSLGRPELWATAGSDLRRPADGRLYLLRVIATAGPEGGLQVRPTGGQGSHQMLPMAKANALALLPDGPGAAAGAKVKIWLLDAEGLAGY